MVERVLFALSLVMIVYQFGLNTIYLLLLVVAGRAMRTHLRSEAAVGPEEVFKNPFTPGVTICIPAYNEAVTITDSMQSFLNLRYPDLQLVICNDGSTDDTLEVLCREYDLVRTYRVVPNYIPCRRIRGVYRSRLHPHMLVIDKENGGRADASNACMNFAEKDLVCCTDADSILEQVALLRVVSPFVQDPHRVIGVGGIIRIANGCEIDAGIVRKVSLARNFWVVMQVVEYLRAFLIGRLGWSQLNASLLISGAFGVWRRDLLVEAGGYNARTLGEDAELTLRMHRLMRRKKIPYRIVFVPDPVCWTEAPSSYKVLKRQRRRWSRGMGETLWLNREMAFNPRYGARGLLAYPYFLVYEFLGAVVELLGFVSLPILLLLSDYDYDFMVLLMLLGILYGTIMTTAAVLLEEFTYRYYQNWSDVLLLVFASCIEMFGFHQLHVWWRFLGVWDLATRKRQAWGQMPRTGFAHTKTPTAA